jgi:hypothetical protein
MSILYIETIGDVDREIAVREQELKELRETKTNMAKDVESNSYEGQLAIFLHDNLCHHNHADGCDWGYNIKNGVHSWNSFAHQRYWNAAVNIINRAASHGRSTKDTVRDVTDMIGIIKACT